jgi:cytochrome c-type biogenesis protein CcmH/NrfG
VIDVADPIEVIEQVTRYFYAMGVQGVKAKAPVEEVGKYFTKAVHAASIAAPYRHPRLSAVKHVDGLGQPGSIDGIRADATPEELRAEIAKAAVAALKQRLERNPNAQTSLALLANCYGHLGRIAEARAAWAEVMRIAPNFSIEWQRRVLQYKNSNDFERCRVKGLRKANISA